MITNIHGLGFGSSSNLSFTYLPITKIKQIHTQAKQFDLCFIATLRNVL